MSTHQLYIQFYSLQTWGVSDPHAFLATSQIYTHSKVMIVDDRKCIFGNTRVSANIVKGDIDDNDVFFCAGQGDDEVQDAWERL